MFSHAFYFQFGVAVKVIRNGEQDAWTDIFSSAAAGAYFGRNGTFARNASKTVIK